MKKFLILILFLIDYFDSTAQDYRDEHHKTFSFPTEIYFISNDSVSSQLNFKWYDSNHDTVQLRNHINKQFVYPEICQFEEVDGSFYFKIYADSIGVVTKVEAIKPIASCSHEIANELKKILWMGFLVDRKKYPYEYFVLKLRAEKIQN